MNNINNEEIIEEIIFEEYAIEKIEELNKNVQKTNVLLLLIFLAICVLIYFLAPLHEYIMEIKNIFSSLK